MSDRGCNAPAELNQVLRVARHVVVLTGSGVSAESGIPTFRDAQTGIWEHFRPEDLATAAAFRKDPKTVWDWYAWRRQLVSEAAPNPGHTALFRLENLVPRLTLITQNVDGLHQRAGSTTLLEFHGNVLRNRCFAEDRRLSEDETKPGSPPSCRHCGSPVRPDVVWFGEAIDEAILAAAFDACAGCDVFLSIGTSSEVYPAAGLADCALAANAVLAEINPDDTPLSAMAHFHLRGPSGTVLPALVAALEGS